MNVPRSKDVIAGFENSEDAAVYRLNEREAILHTIDVITPLVDDAHSFGRIAAANSLSDIYAMGGMPLTALSFVGYPKKGDLELLRQILAGGIDMLQNAGCFLVGGHTVADEELKIGFAVTGRVEISSLKRNCTAREGDSLVLTKPVGTGVIATAIKQGNAPDPVIANAIRWMTELNRDAAELMVQNNASAATDITGFGLLGHAMEMAKGSAVTIEIDAGAVPLLDGSFELAIKSVPGGTSANREYVSDSISIESNLSTPLLNLLFDPQTSGGLLVSLSDRDVTGFVQQMESRGRMARIIGRVRPYEGFALRLV